MDTRVYINNREVCSKASDGVSKAAFPDDPCWTPPSPPAGPIVVPYPNTAYASTLKDGTTTVFVCNSMVAKEDISCFSTSTGDEPATQSQPKGVMTGVIKGKAYFNSWSPNVKFEGKCVARHEDLISHNHGSFPSNTPVFPYVSRGIFGHDCSKEENRIEKACEPEKDKSDTKKAIHSKSKFLQLLKKIREKENSKNKSNKKKWHWTDDHCDGLNISIPDDEAAQQYIDEIKEAVNSLTNELNMIHELENALKDMVINAASKAAVKVAAKAAAKQVAGSVIPGAGNVVMGIWTAIDIAISIGDVAEIKSAAEEGLEQIKLLKDKINELKALAKKIKDFENLSFEEQKKMALELQAEIQDILAIMNACTRARKCNLVPYDLNNALTGNRASKVEASDKGGCCRGQTGHHLIYDSMVKEVCPGYNKGLAPVVCVEGTSWHKGSHARIHTAMDSEVRKLVRQGETANGSMSMDQAIEAAVKSHEKAFPYARCSTECIRKQLRAYYKQVCPYARPKTTNKNGKQHEDNVDISE
ncbi:DUF4150 domain-containing protein [Escherichia coli]|nr:DUF4150 domain-containing protein [Escherichia coli]EHU6147897.1 DUF4150 domain-containing protein [Escherichia coli]